MAYRRRASPLHAARASIGSGLCGALALIALLHDHPLVLAAVVVAVVAVGVAASVGRELLRVVALALPFALAIALLNPLVSREGLTVLGTLRLPLLPRLDLTLEATVYGGLLGLRALALIGAFALFSLAVDPDELLRLVRRVSLRSALTATVATRMVPLLARDGRRIADAQRCRPGPPPSRVVVLRAVAGGALERAVDVAAALEVRGYGAAHAPRHAGAVHASALGRTVAMLRERWVDRGRVRAPWSRHDRAFAAATVALLALAFGALRLDAAPFETYPALDGRWDPAVVAVAVALVAAPLLPFLDRRGIAP